MTPCYLSSGTNRSATLHEEIALSSAICSLVNRHDFHVFFGRSPVGAWRHSDKRARLIPLHQRGADPTLQVPQSGVRDRHQSASEVFKGWMLIYFPFTEAKRSGVEPDERI